MATQKLYYEDVYTKEFTAAVLSCEAVQGGYAVILDRTAFYPEGGGQPCDLGVLGGAKVLDVQEKGDEIVHLCDAPLEGEVSGSIDWPRRFDLMQQHSGEHLLSGLVHRRYGFDNVGFHMGADVLTVDFSGIIPAADLPGIEAQINVWVWQNAVTEALWPSEDELKTMFYRSKKALSGKVRIIRFPFMDDCACCGTHVARTGEIGVIKLLSCVRFHQGVRIELICGQRAYDYLCKIYEQNRAVSGLLSAKPVETADAVRRAQDEHAALKYELGAWKQRYFATLAETLCRGQYRESSRADAAAQYVGPYGAVLAFEPGLSPADVQQLCLLLMEKTDRICAVFSGDDTSGYKYAIGQTNGSLRDFIRDFNAKCQGRGGGKPQFAQGSAQANRSDIEAFFVGDGALDVPLPTVR